ncbi:hypothetical protein [Bradyrhizobium sp. 33ap4]|uniref:hypothetical protein n=1 Tax=Bradyrhizobium sp. 33ap4 TaxID=3061630 RepID=UPI00293105F6|nr:hypothetical protein [Bradyrhizobium sp. 33ap4]
MTGNDTLSARAENSARRARMMIAGAFAYAAMLLPAGAWGLDGPPRQIPERANHLLPLPPIPYLDSMQWMSWKPSPPLFKMDTLLLPDSNEPNVLRLPSDLEGTAPQVS